MSSEDWISLIAAIAQAAAALLIVVLAFFLARYAGGAKQAAQRQADVGTRALDGSW